MFEFNNGVRDHFEYKEAMFVNSLFKDYLDVNGLKTWKNESTRDIICLEFNYGSRSYEDEINHLRNVINRTHQSYLQAVIHEDQYLIKSLYQRKKQAGL